MHRGNEWSHLGNLVGTQLEKDRLRKTTCPFGGDVLRTNWDTVEETARALLEHETLSGVALEAVLSTTQTIDMHSIPVPERDIDARRHGLE
jgi:hypothetical protein